jgi:hypothetical protein
MDGGWYYMNVFRQRLEYVFDLKEGGPCGNKSHNWRVDVIIITSC